jgi:hypothetical protein
MWPPGQVRAARPRPPDRAAAAGGRGASARAPETEADAHRPRQLVVELRDLLVGVAEGLLRSRPGAVREALQFRLLRRELLKGLRRLREVALPVGAAERRDARGGLPRGVEDLRGLRAHGIGELPDHVRDPSCTPSARARARA